MNVFGLVIPALAALAAALLVHAGIAAWAVIPIAAAFGVSLPFWPTFVAQLVVAALFSALIRALKGE